MDMENTEFIEQLARAAWDETEKRNHYVPQLAWSDASDLQKRRYRDIARIMVAKHAELTAPKPDPVVECAEAYGDCTGGHLDSTRAALLRYRELGCPELKP